MTKFFLKIHDTLSKHRLATAIALLLAVAGMVALAMRVNYEEDIAKFLPREKDNEKYAQIYEQIAQQDKIAVIFGSRDSTRQLPVETLEAAMQQFATLMGERGIDNVQVTVDEEKTLHMIEFVYQNVPYFLTEGDYDRIAAQATRLHREPTRARQEDAHAAHSQHDGRKHALRPAAPFHPSAC